MGVLVLARPEVPLQMLLRRLKGSLLRGFALRKKAVAVPRNWPKKGRRAKGEPKKRLSVSGLNRSAVVKKKGSARKLSKRRQLVFFPILSPALPETACSAMSFPRKRREAASSTTIEFQTWFAVASLEKSLIVQCRVPFAAPKT